MADLHPDYEFATSVKGVCERVLVSLGDAEVGHTNQRWSESQVKTMVLDAICITAELIPSAFTVTDEFFLSTKSCLQELPAGCDRLVEIVCITDTRTGEVTEASRTEELQIKRNNLYPARCSTGCSTSTQAFQYSLSTSSKDFNVSPKPTEDQRYEVTAKCVQSSKLLDPENWCDIWPSELKPWILPISQLATGLLLIGNKDSAGAASVAQTYFTQFALFSNIALNRVLQAAGVSDTDG